MRRRIALRGPTVARTAPGAVAGVAVVLACTGCDMLVGLDTPTTAGADDDAAGAARR